MTSAMIVPRQQVDRDHAEAGWNLLLSESFCKGNYHQQIYVQWTYWRHSREDHLHTIKTVTVPGPS